MKVDTKSTYRETRTCYLCKKVGHIARDCRVMKRPSLAPQSIVKALHASVKSDDCTTLAHERAGDDQHVTIDNGRNNNNNKNSIYLYSAIYPELKFCSEALITTSASQ